MKNDIKCKNRISYDDKGSAIITALVVSTVLMVLCLSLLAIAYSFFLSQKTSSSDLSDREILYSAVEVFEEGILSAKHSPDELDPYSDDTVIVDDSLKQFGEYLLKNVWKGFAVNSEGKYEQSANSSEWLYYNENMNDNHGNLDYKPGVNKICSKFYNLTTIGSRKIVAQLYWTLPDGWDGNIENKDNTELHAIYVLYNNKMEELVRTERTYKLEKDYFTSDGTNGESPAVVNTNTAYKIVFNNANDVQKANAYYLPSAIYCDNLDTPGIPIEKVTTSWYYDKKCNNQYELGSAIDLSKANKETVSGQTVISLYTDWGGHKPILIRFIIGTKVVYKGYILLNKSESLLDVDDYPVTQVLMDQCELNEGEKIDEYLGWYYKPNQMDKFFRESGSDNGKCQSVNVDTDVYAIFESYKNKSTIPPGRVPGFKNKNNLTDLFDDGSTYSSQHIYYHWVRIVEP